MLKLIFATLMLSISAAHAELDTNTRTVNPSSLTVEILGRGLTYSVGFDQVVSPSLSVGFAFGTSATDFENTETSTGKRAYLIPIYVNFYLQPTPGSIFITGGADVVVNSKSVRDFEAATSSVHFPSDVILPTFGLGFEQRTDNGFLFRVAGYGIAGDRVKPWAGFTFGYAF